MVGLEKFKSGRPQLKHAVASWGLGKQRLLENSKDKDLT